jgi:hypothetical protein
MLLAELGRTSEYNRFTGINYDGNVRTNAGFSVIGGTEAIETGMQNYLAASPVDADRDLTAALQLGLEAWAIGSELSSRQPEDTKSEDTQIDTQQMHEIISVAREDGEIEAGVLETTQRETSKFRLLSTQEIETALL